MSTFWSLWIIIITLSSICGIAVLLYWCSSNNTEVKEGEDMGHEYDGIREINNPLPKWWSYMFWGTIILGLIYLILFPGLGNFKGLLGWQSSDQRVTSLKESKQSIDTAYTEQTLDQYAKELAYADKKFGAVFKTLTYNAQGTEYLSLAEISKNPEALKVGQRLFLQNCAQCHGSDARGQIGFPNLSDDTWLYGGDDHAIKASILNGRQGIMPAWQLAFGDEGVQDVTSYVLSLSGRKVNVKQAMAGKQRFAVCAGCHGSDGKGNIALGAPNLTDNNWLYGGSRRDVEATIAHGRQGNMPAWKDILGEDKIQLISTYVWNLNNSKE